MYSLLLGEYSIQINEYPDSRENHSEILTLQLQLSPLRILFTKTRHHAVRQKVSGGRHHLHILDITESQQWEKVVLLYGRKIRNISMGEQIKKLQ